MDTQSEGLDLYTTIDEDNIAWLHFDKQNASTNVLSASVLEAFYDELLELVERAPRGLVVKIERKLEAGEDPLAILAECRVAWGLPEETRLDYRFLREQFAQFLSG